MNTSRNIASAEMLVLQGGCRLLAAAVAILSAAATLAASPGSTFEGEVVEVVDGDTIRIRAESNEYTVRLAAIDAPETDQPYGDEAQRALADKVAAQPVRVKTEGATIGERVSGAVYVGERSINFEMVQDGHAWTSDATNKALISAQGEAKAAGKGLWAAGDAVAPWLWRRRQQREAGAARPRDATATDRSRDLYRRLTKSVSVQLDQSLRIGVMTVAKREWDSRARQVSGRYVIKAAFMYQVWLPGGRQELSIPWGGVPCTVKTDWRWGAEYRGGKFWCSYPPPGITVETTTEMQFGRFTLPAGTVLVRKTNAWYQQ